TLRRHPEGAWIKSPDDIARFPDVQLRLLEASINMLKPGGTLIYCVCTPLKREGAEVIERVLASGACVRDSFRAEELGDFANGLTEAGDVLTLPNGKFSHDFFFISRLKRK
ncbi:MAG: MFS transporter, partial [Rhodospirillaceae bacterium]